MNIVVLFFFWLFLFYLSGNVHRALNAKLCMYSGKLRLDIVGYHINIYGSVLALLLVIPLLLVWNYAIVLSGN